MGIDNNVPGGSGGGGASASGNNSFSGNNTFTGTNTFSKIVQKGDDSLGGTTFGIFFLDSLSNQLGHLYPRTDTGKMQFDGAVRAANAWRFVQGLTTSSDLNFSGSDAGNVGLRQSGGSDITLYGGGQFFQPTTPSGATAVPNLTYVSAGDGALGAPTVSIGAQVVRDRTVSFQFKDRLGANFAQTCAFLVVSSSVPDAAGDAGDETISVGSGRSLGTLVATTSNATMVQTNSGNAAFNIKVTKPTAGNVYLGILMPDSHFFVTSVIAFT